jgi:hypothetical protein
MNELTVLNPSVASLSPAFDVDFSRDRPVSEGIATAPSLIESTAEVNLERAKRLFKLSETALPNVFNTNSGLAAFIAASVAFHNRSLPPDVARCYVATLMAYESSYKQHAYAGDQTKASGYLQMIPSTRAASLQSGLRLLNTHPHLLTGKKEFDTEVATALGLFTHYLSHIFEYWRFSNGWQPKKNVTGAVTSYILQNYGSILRDKYEGLMLLLVGVHFYSGAYALKPSKRLTHEFTGRFGNDVLLYRMFYADRHDLTAEYLAAVARRYPVISPAVREIGAVIPPFITAIAKGAKSIVGKIFSSKDGKVASSRITQGMPLRAPWDQTKIFIDDKGSDDSDASISLQDGKNYRLEVVVKGGFVIDDSIRSGQVLRKGDVFAHGGKRRGKDSFMTVAWPTKKAPQQFLTSVVNDILLSPDKFS